MRRALPLALALAALVPAAAGAGPTRSLPGVRAAAYLVEDARTGEVLAASNPHERLPIASITKLMTVLVTLDHHRLSDVVAADPRAAAVGESTIDLAPHEQLTVADLIRGALIQSANDAADALALSIAPSFRSFAALMNAKAAALGLRETHFVRPDGLDAAGEYSTAADATRLAQDAMRIPFVRDTVREPTATIAGGRTLHTWDDLLAILPQVIGVKTGHTAKAGWCQVAAVRGDGVTIYATLLGSPSRQARDVDLEALLLWGLDQFRVVDAVAPERVYATVRLPFGRTVQLVAGRRFRTVVHLGRRLSQTVVAPVVASLPVRAGQPLGRIEVRGADGTLLATRNLVAARTVNKPGLLGRLGWYAGRTVRHLLDFL